MNGKIEAKDLQAVDAMRILSRYCKDHKVCDDCVFHIRSEYSTREMTCLFFCEDTPELTEEIWEERKNG